MNPQQTNNKVQRLTESQFYGTIEEGVIRILQEIANSDSSPKVYVGTYGKYNNDSLKGEWFDLEDYSDYDEFIEACRQLHSDESDPEFMFQDMEYVPDIFGGESWLSPEIFDYIHENENYDFDLKYAVAQRCNSIEEYFNCIDDVRIYSGCDDMTDVAMMFIDETGGVERLSTETLQQYFDFEQFGRDCSFDGPSDADEDETIYEEWGVDEGDDEALGEEMFAQLGAEGIGRENLSKYFDYKKYGRDMEIDGTFFSYGDGYAEIV